MTWPDWVVIAALAISILISFVRGFLYEFMALAVWAAAIWVALVYADQLAPLIGERVELPSARLAIAFAALFLATLVAGSLLNFLLSMLVKQTGLSGTDRFLGLFFGAARGLLLVVVAVSLLTLTPLSQDPWWQQSALLPRIESLARWASQYLPEDFRRYVAPEELPEPGVEAADAAAT